MSQVTKTYREDLSTTPPDPRDEEIARLRKALEDIASGKYSGVILTSFPPQDAAVNRARAALNGKDK